MMNQAERSCILGCCKSVLSQLMEFQVGIDYLNILQSCSREFDIQLNNDDFVPLLKKKLSESPEHADLGIDFLVSDFVQFVEESVQTQNPEENHDVFARVKRILIDCLCLDEDEVTPSAWMLRDLGLS